MQVVTTVERSGAGSGVRVQVDRCAQQSDRASLVEELYPAGATSRNEGLETRRGAREVVRNAVAQLAVTRNREAQYVFSIVVQNAMSILSASTRQLRLAAARCCPPGVCASHCKICRGPILS